MQDTVLGTVRKNIDKLDSILALKNLLIVRHKKENKKMIARTMIKGN